MTLRLWLRSTRSLIEEVFEHVFDRAAPGNLGRKERPLQLVTLEDRIVFSATPLPVLPVEPGTEPADVQSSPQNDLIDQSGQRENGSDDGNQSEESLATQPRPSDSSKAATGTDGETTADLLTVSRHELVIIDPAVSDYQAFIDDLTDGGTNGRSIEVTLLNDHRDGIDQISDILAEYDDLDALHIISHGSEGAVQLGATWLRAGNLSAYATQLTGWQDALKDDADLFLYGCELAGNQDGRLIVESLSLLTGADVAASTDETGHAHLGGDWDLEYRVGPIESEVAVSDDIQQGWISVLEAAPTGGETLVNTTIANKQERPDVATDADGNYVVVWESNQGGNSDIYMQRYDSDGNQLGLENLVNTTTNGDQERPAVGMDADGDFVVVWEGNGDQSGEVDDKGVSFDRRPR